MFKPVLKPLTTIDRALACSMAAGLALGLIEYGRLLALPTHFV